MAYACCQIETIAFWAFLSSRIFQQSTRHVPAQQSTSELSIEDEVPQEFGRFNEAKRTQAQKSRLGRKLASGNMDPSLDEVQILLRNENLTQVEGAPSSRGEGFPSAGRCVVRTHRPICPPHHLESSNGRGLDSFVGSFEWYFCDWIDECTELHGVPGLVSPPRSPSRSKVRIRKRGAVWFLMLPPPTRSCLCKTPKIVSQNPRPRVALLRGR
ncbi:hypothetical protein K438DRAFT_1926748 [Mycena galopus ATCC 62051]|nr:hypothetical protein K438DRAFT_1926748 [Mycena galopus ATCC 62051]